jgi:hypothetical protein
VEFAVRKTVVALLVSLFGCFGVRSQTGPDGLFGTRSQGAVELPEFRAVNQAGVPRGRADLLGRPTVLWFFPAAGTPG